MLRAAVPSPCLCCNRFEIDILNKAAEESEEACWEYTFPVRSVCGRCGNQWNRFYRSRGWSVGMMFGIGSAVSYYADMPKLTGFFGMSGLVASYFAYYCKDQTVTIALPESSIEVLERSIEAAAVAEKGSKHRAHGTLVHHLSMIEKEGTVKMALLSWMPYVMDGWMRERPGFARKLLRRSFLDASDSMPIDTHLGNPDVEDGEMKGTMLQGHEFGEEDRVKGELICPGEPKTLANQIGPDIQPTEVMESSFGNMKCGLAKRVQPLPFMASDKMKKKIRLTVKRVIEVVFTKEKIRKWREENPDFSEMASKKWSQDRFEHAWDEALAEVGASVEHEFQIKVNEALPAKGKAPRPIIQSGDRGQILMMMPVKCFEDLLFEYFEDASIKHCPKHEAMKRVANHLKQTDTHLIEGDGSAWDSCCTPEVREMTENTVIAHIIRCLVDDAQIPQDWMDAMLKDMRSQKIRGKNKMIDFFIGKSRVTIDAIRQSGHRGTSAFNWFINFICWICVLACEPWELVGKTDGKLNTWYRSSHDGSWHEVKYAFEGDDSAISTTESVKGTHVEGLWTSLGFRMKLVYVKDKMTFTGYDFLCNKDGPTGCFMPEIARNISSSSWTCSSLVKMDKSKIHEVGMAAMLARAENFVDFGPLCAYFAALGISHVNCSVDREIEEKEALNLGISACSSISQRLYELYGSASYPSKDMRRLAEVVVGKKIENEEYLNMLSSHFDSPTDTATAMRILPRCLWGCGGLEKARR